MFVTKFNMNDVDNCNTTKPNVYGARLITKAIAIIYLVHLMNADSFSSGHWPQPGQLVWSVNMPITYIHYH